MENLERILSEHPFVKGLEPRYLELVVGCAANTLFKEGEYLFHEGEEANNFYIIRHGKVAVELYTPERGAVIIDALEEGDILGWSWLIPPYHWHFDGRAIEQTRAIALDGKCLRGKCEKDHDLGYELLKRFANVMEDRLESTRMRLLDVYSVRA